MLQIKFDCNRPAGLGDIHVWKCGRTDGQTNARTPARVPSYKLTLWAFGSGELIIPTKLEFFMNDSHVWIFTNNISRDLYPWAQIKRCALRHKLKSLTSQFDWSLFVTVPWFGRPLVPLITTPSHIIPTLGWPVLALPRKSECQLVPVLTKNILLHLCTYTQI